MQKIVEKCDNSDCSFKQSPSAALTLFPQNLLNTLNIGANLSLGINDLNDSEQNQVINSIFNDTLLKELDIPSNINEILLDFKSFCQCCDCTREKSKSLLKDNDCQKDCLSYGKSDNEVIKLNEKRTMQSEKFLNLMGQFASPPYPKAEEDRVYLKLLTRLSSNIAPNNDVRIGPIARDILLGIRTLQKCRKCYENTLNL